MNTEIETNPIAETSDNHTPASQDIPPIDNATKPPSKRPPYPMRPVVVLDAPLPGLPGRTYRDISQDALKMNVAEFCKEYAVFTGGSDDIKDHLELLVAYLVLSNELLRTVALKPSSEWPPNIDMQYYTFGRIHRSLVHIYCSAIFEAYLVCKFSLNPSVDFYYFINRTGDILFLIAYEKVWAGR